MITAAAAGQPVLELTDLPVPPSFRRELRQRKSIDVRASLPDRAA